MKFMQYWLKSTLIALALLATGCEVETETKTGPNGSWWVGGADGGVFIQVMDDANPNDERFTGTVYFEHDQSIWYQGPLRLVGKTQLDPADRSQYLGWDGERLHLDGGAWLEAVDPVPPL